MPRLLFPSQEDIRSAMILPMAALANLWTVVVKIDVSLAWVIRTQRLLLALVPVRAIWTACKMLVFLAWFFKVPNLVIVLGMDQLVVASN